MLNYKKLITYLKNYFINYLDSYIKKSFKKDYLKDPAMMSYSPTMQKIDLTADHQRITFNEIFLNIWCGGNLELKNKIYQNWGVKLYLLNSSKIISKSLLWLETLIIFRNFFTHGPQTPELLKLLILTLINTTLSHQRRKHFHPQISYGPENIISIHDYGKNSFLEKYATEIYVKGFPLQYFEEKIISSKLEPMESEIAHLLYQEGFQGSYEDLVKSSILLAQTR